MSTAENVIFDPDTHSHNIDDDFVHPGHEELEQRGAIPVYDVVSQQERAAEYCSHITVETLNATDPVPVQRLFPQARRRKRAVVSSRGLLTGEQNEFVFIGSMSEVQGNRGVKLWNGQSIVFESQPELWIAPGTNPPTHTVCVTVIDERYE